MLRLFEISDHETPLCWLCRVKPVEYCPLIKTKEGRAPPRMRGGRSHPLFSLSPRGARLTKASLGRRWTLAPTLQLSKIQDETQTFPACERQTTTYSDVKVFGRALT
jgi:hypothetical protein